MKVLIFPKGQNPYQELLYSQLRINHPNDAFTYVEATRINFFFYILIFAYRRMQGYKIIHIHWLVFSTGLSIPFAKYLSYAYNILCIKSLNYLGYKIIWTVHDILPHETETKDDLKISIMLSKLASSKIAHSRYSFSQMRNSGLSIENTVLIPHGNYDKVYPIKISPMQARKQLKIEKSDTVILFFGMIRPYKGVDDLLEAYKNLSLPNTRLLIVGKCEDKKFAKKIKKAQLNKRIDYYEGYVDDRDVAMYFLASDIVCLPFKSITTSGSVLLALTFGKVVVAPKSGSLSDLPNNVGYLYNPVKEGALFDSLRLALSSKSELLNLGKNAQAYSDTLSWALIAVKTYDVYKKALKS